MTQTPHDLVVGLLRAKGPLPGGEALEGFDYVDSGHVDSLGLIKFIAALEAALDIEITDTDIESDRFRVVGGLIELLEEKAAEQDIRKRSAAS